MGERTENHSPSTTLGSGRSIPRGYLPFVQAGTSLAIFRSLMANFSRINHAFRCTIGLSPVCLSADLNGGDGPSKDNSRLIRRERKTRACNRLAGGTTAGGGCKFPCHGTIQAAWPEIHGL